MNFDCTPDGRIYDCCRGRTKQGNPCRRGARKGSAYCEAHQHQAPPDPPDYEGKIYILDTGISPMRITDFDYHTQVATVEYLKSGVVTYYPIDRLSSHPDYPEGDTIMTAKLYRVLAEDEAYGTFLTQNSRGEYVLEMKGAGGAVRAFDPKRLEEVLPYTFDVKFGEEGAPYSFCGVAGQLQAGDLLLNDDGQPARVVKVDSKNRKATRFFSGWKIPAERISTKPKTGE